MMKKTFKLLLIVGLILSTTIIATVVFAEDCFYSSKKANEDAQNIRLKALDMGWGVGKTSSLAFAGIIKGKAELYPKDEVEVCLRELCEGLQIRVRSLSKDAGRADWHKLKATKEKETI